MEENLMKIKTARKYFAIFIIGLFFVGAAQIGLSTSETKVGPILNTSQPENTDAPLTEGWIYRKPIAIDHTKVAGDLTNYPIFISLTDPDLQAKAQTDGDDILFMSASGQQLNHEIDTYDSSTGELCAWINITSVSSTVDTVFYMYYGNPNVTNQQMPEQVWDQYFTGVWHLTDFYDSTLYENHGVNYGSIASSGKIGDARAFDGINDYIKVANDPSLNFNIPNKFTISLWMKRDRLNTYECFISKGTASTNKGYIVQIRENNTILVGLYDGSDEYLLHSNQTITDTNWHYITSVWDGTHQYIYIDGVFDNSVDIGAVTIADDSKPLEFGSHYGYGSGQVFFDGDIDDIQIAKVNRNADWISTTYTNQNAPSEFYSVGPEVLQEPPATPQQPTGTTVGEVGVQYSYTTSTTDPEGDLVYYQWDWGDGSVSDWLGPFVSGAVVSASHAWAIGGDYEITVKAKDFFYRESSWSAPLSIIIDLPPATPVTPSGPILCEVGVEYTYATSTTDPENDPVYYKWDWGDGTVSDWLGPFNSGVVVTALHSWSVGDDYQIKVKAKDSYPLESGWSGSLSILIDTPPVQPQKPSGSIKGEPGVEYTYTTTTSDLDSDTLYYMWSWGDGNTSGWYGPFNSNVIASASHVWTEKGTYQIKVKAKDEHGFESDWSDPLTGKMPFFYNYNPWFFFEKLFERFPNAFPILRHLMGY
jgi:hypothetical protein